MSPEFDVHAYVRTLATTYTSVSEVWLVGSRVNGTVKPTSDWDLLVFADESTFNALRDDHALHHPDVDLLVVKSSDGSFEKPWGRKKTGSLANWEWKRISDTEATYRSTKFIPDPGETHLGDFHEQTLKATRVWPER